jgi:hypothetical protein
MRIKFNVITDRLGRKFASGLLPSIPLLYKVVALDL